MSGRLTVVTTARAGQPGLLTWQAWDALRTADEVYLADTASREWLVALADAGVTAQALDVGTVGMAELAQRLLGGASGGHSVVWLGSADGDPGLTMALTRQLVAGANVPDRDAAASPEIEVLAGAWDRPGSAVLELAAVMDRLRSPGGCPWDAEQTHESLVRYVLEEAYEVAEAIEHGTRDDVVEELGDLLLQVVFHARVGEEADEDAFTLDEVAEGITAKLRRRHPHVFADVHAPTVDAVAANWEEIKRVEKGRQSDFDGVPVNLPALARADKVLGRYERAGLALPVLAGDGLATQVLTLVVAARARGVDLEAAVRDAVRALIDHGRDLESGSD